MLVYFVSLILKLLTPTVHLNISQEGGYPRWLHLWRQKNITLHQNGGLNCSPQKGRDLTKVFTLVRGKMKSGMPCLKNLLGMQMKTKIFLDIYVNSFHSWANICALVRSFFIGHIWNLVLLDSYKIYLNHTCLSK